VAIRDQMDGWRPWKGGVDRARATTGVGSMLPASRRCWCGLCRLPRCSASACVGARRQRTRRSPPLLTASSPRLVVVVSRVALVPGGRLASRLPNHGVRVRGGIWGIWRPCILSAFRFSRRSRVVHVLCRAERQRELRSAWTSTTDLPWIRASLSLQPP
jgi:hypothetical protein